MSEGQGSSRDEPERRPPGAEAEGRTPWAAPGGEPSDPGSPGTPPGGQAEPGAGPYPPQGGYGTPGGYQQQPGGCEPSGGYGTPGAYGTPEGYGAPGGYGPPPPYGRPGPYGEPAPRPGIIPLRPLTVTDILDGAIRLIRSNPKATLGLSAVVAAVSTLPVTIAEAFVLGATFDVLLSGEPGTGATTAVFPFAQVIGSGLSLIVQFFAVTILTGVLTRVLGRAVFGGRITVPEAWELTKRQVPALLGLALVTSLILAAPMVVLVGLTVAAFAADAVALVPLIVIGGLLGYLVYVVFFGVRLALAAPAVVLERRGVTAALARSWRLTAQDFWRVLGVILLTYLITFLIGLVIGIPFSLISLAIGFAAGGAGGGAAVAIVQAVGSTVAAMITYPLQAGVFGLLYTDRRMRAEAFDLVLQTAAVDQQRLGWVPASADDLWAVPGTPGPPGYGAA